MRMSRNEYLELVKRQSPNSPIWRDVLNAFWTGGLICVLGQLILNGYDALGLEEGSAATAVSVSLIFLGALLTGLGLYSKIAKLAGAGTVVPITGFANSVVAPALEFKTDVRCIIRIVRETRNRRMIEQPENLGRMNKDLPVWFFAGDHDPVGNMGQGVRRAAEAFRQAGMKHVTVTLYEGRHEMLNEKNKQQVYADVLHWLESQRG